MKKEQRECLIGVFGRIAFPSPFLTACRASGHICRIKKLGELSPSPVCRPADSRALQRSPRRPEGCEDAQASSADAMRR